MKHITVIMSLHEIDLAQKIADKIICVKGDTISHFGRPEDIFEENMIRDLYDINNGFFDPLFGSIELPKPGGRGENICDLRKRNGYSCVPAAAEGAYARLLQEFFIPMM